MARRYVLLTTSKFDTAELLALLQQTAATLSIPADAVAVLSPHEIPHDQDADVSEVPYVVAQAVPETALYTVASRLSFRATVTIFERCDLAAVSAWIAQKVGTYAHALGHLEPCSPARR